LAETAFAGASSRRAATIATVAAMRRQAIGCFLKTDFMLIYVLSLNTLYGGSGAFIEF
jgi:hypothetical protein